MTRRDIPAYPLRQGFALGLIALVMLLLVFRAVYLHVIDRSFLQGQGDARHLRVVEVPAHRGTITDRYGEPLAMSTPVDSVWVNPKEFVAARAQWPALEKVLSMPGRQLEQLLRNKLTKEFVYLRRHIDPAVGEQVMALKLPGVSLQREYRRYYPTGEVSSHVVGFTNVDDSGQEGVELAYDHWLSGRPGAKRVLRDRLGRVVQNVESIRQPVPGKDVKVTIDRRLQYLAYRELKAAVMRHSAHSGSAVVLDAHTGEILAMVNQPSFNPNNRAEISGGKYRNRAVTDMFEPGSTIKPFTIAAALELGTVKPETVIDTYPGSFRLGRYTIKDVHNLGSIDVTTVLQKSSNVGAAKIGQTTDPARFWQILNGVGFGVSPATGFPGEGAGYLSHYSQWREIGRVSLSFGYGMSASALQLAQAYAVLANDGRRVPLRIVEGDRSHEINREQGSQVMPPHVARQVRTMLETVTQPGGTASAAAVPGFRVAGKTGTVKKNTAGAYTQDRYQSLFVGMAPASKPRLVMAVVVNEPGPGGYYGGIVAAPVFGQVMAGALRLMNIAPDNWNEPVALPAPAPAVAAEEP